ncbi:MAG: DNA internalization-related competence protein ComEC/Rec2 [Bacillota bacterium]
MIFFKQRPLLLVFLYLAGGIITFYYFTFNFLIITFILLMFFTFIKTDKKVIAIVLILIYFLGNILVFIEEYKYNSNYSLSKWTANKSVYLVGIVKEDLKNLNGDKIYLKVKQINNSKIKYGKLELSKNYLPYKLRENEIYSGYFEIKEVKGKENPGAFSYKDHLKKRGIYAVGYYDKKLNFISKNSTNFREIIVNIKKKLIAILDKNLKEPYNDVIKALLLGERARLKENWEEVFTLSGANHLLAISGLHVGFILLILLKFCKLIKLNNLFLKNSLITLVLFSYIFITGLRASVLRASLLAIFFLWGKYLDRNADIYNILALSAVLNLIIYPYALFDIGFQLSYLVLLMILLYYNFFSKIFPGLLAVSISAQLGSVLITSYYFNMITPMGIITNLWAIPLTALIVIISFISLIIAIVFPIIFKVSSVILEILINLLYNGMYFSTLFPYGNFEIATPKLINVIFVYFILITAPILFKKRSIPPLRRKNLFYKKIFYITLVLLIILNLSYKTNRDLEIIFFSVGQGDSILLTLTNGDTILIDGGGMAGLNNNQGEVVLLPYLKHKGIKKIDLAMVTHFDTDHALGIKTLLEKDRISALILPINYTKNDLSTQIVNLAQKKGVEIYETKRGDKIKNEEIEFLILHPFLENNYLNKSKNNNSIVVKVNYRNFSLLLTGDLEKEGELKLIEMKDDLKSTVLKIGHHGSDSSTTEEFLAAVKAKEAIISVGENNYGHPDEKVINRIDNFKINKWVTKDMGAVIISTDGYSYSIKGYNK